MEDVFTITVGMVVASAMRKNRRDLNQRCATALAINTHRSAAKVEIQTGPKKGEKKPFALRNVTVLPGMMPTDSEELDDHE